ncbi:hypothetical protein CB0940_10424 [Cercospora beticola]|uniref:Uncharacterized protein n=1 Tax=Cercospora beticola TaxID=122368 RepID=A0A2G5HT37_CERBT|nr:hypothetical protein CB0940_10424 [Cercospora beticola]PIA95704.1 hypothetical protein CB0940_10424 [Cercospora beticola]WPB07141.1 hypothetical protein RHO25_011801 [Cercospora beticola]
MLSFQLRRGQLELQIHRHWLRTFQLTHGEQRLRHFSAVHRNGREEKPRWSPIAQARLRAETENRRERAQQRRNAAETDPNLSDAQQRKRERWEGRRSSPVQTVELKALAVRQDLLDAVQANNISAVFRLYNELPEKRPLIQGDFKSIALCTLRAWRAEAQRPMDEQSTDKKQEMVSFAETLAKDIRQGNIVPSRSAHSYLLLLFLESGHIQSGVKFWTWLETQDDQHNGYETYTMAIKLLGSHGLPLQELESLYSRALARYPGTFNAYHLSPNAILPDREATMDLRLPLDLLQEITTQRLLRGDSRQAYLALDTAFRVYPTHVSPRFIKPFLEERPNSEAYTVFAMACRAGVILPFAYVRLLVSRLRTMTAENTSIRDRIAILRAMLATVYLHVGVTGKALPNILSELIIATTLLFRLPGIDKMEGVERKKLVDVVLLSIRGMMETFARFGALPSTAAFNSIIVNIAGHGQSTETLKIVLDDFQTLKLERTDVTRRSLLSVAGLWDNKDLVEEFWTQIVEARQLKGEAPDPTDFFVLSKAVKTTGQFSFAELQFNKLKALIPHYQHSSIEYAIAKAQEPEDVHDTSSGANVNFEELHDGLQKLAADIAVLEAVSRDGSVVQDYSGKRLPLKLLPAEGALDTTEDVMRKVYDAMTTEQSTPSSESRDVVEKDPENASRPAPRVDRSITNLTLGDLRYETWKDINYLLQLAEEHDEHFNEAVDRSIANSERPPNREMGFTKEELEDMHGFGLSETQQEKRGADSRVGLIEYRKEVMRLRGIAAAP